MASKEKVVRPRAVFAHQHRDEGFALDWSQLSQGRLASGDNKASLYVWDPSSNATAWTVKQYKVPRSLIPSKEVMNFVIIFNKLSIGHYFANPPRIVDRASLEESPLDLA